MQEVKARVSIIFFFLSAVLINPLVGQEKSYEIPMRIMPKIFIQGFHTGQDTTFSFQFISRNKIKTDKLPFFCRIEDKMSNQARFPIRIRLGSLDYVNKLEGKGH